MGRVTSIVFIAALLVFTAGCQYERVSMWELKCESCHDGKSIIDGEVLSSKQEMMEMYKGLEEFVDTCNDAPDCMNILKHDKDLFRKVGVELGLK